MLPSFSYSTISSTTSLLIRSNFMRLVFSQPCYCSHNYQSSIIMYLKKKVDKTVYQIGIFFFFFKGLCWWCGLIEGFQLSALFSSFLLYVLCAKWKNFNESIIVKVLVLKLHCLIILCFRILKETPRLMGKSSSEGEFWFHQLGLLLDSGGMLQWMEYLWQLNLLTVIYIPH